MSIAEFLVVYLSAGAPFGVLVYFSGSSFALPIRLIRAFSFALLWPAVALAWIHRRLLLGRTADRRLDGLAQPTFGSDPVVSEYITLTTAVNDSEDLSGELQSELFEIAGHSSPHVAAVCAARRRNVLLRHRQHASAAALEDYLKIRKWDETTFVEAIANECRRLGDSRTADRISSGPVSEREPIVAKKIADEIQLAA